MGQAGEIMIKVNGKFLLRAECGMLQGKTMRLMFHNIGYFNNGASWFKPANQNQCVIKNLDASSTSGSPNWDALLQYGANTEVLNLKYGETESNGKNRCYISSGKTSSPAGENPTGLGSAFVDQAGAADVSSNVGNKGQAPAQGTPIYTIWAR